MESQVETIGPGLWRFNHTISFRAYNATYDDDDIYTPHMMLARLRKLADGKADPGRQKWRQLAASIIKCQIPNFNYRDDLG